MVQGCISPTTYEVTIMAIRKSKSASAALLDPETELAVIKKAGLALNDVINMTRWERREFLEAFRRRLHGQPGRLPQKATGFGRMLALQYEAGLRSLTSEESAELCELQIEWRDIGDEAVAAEAIPSRGASSPSSI
jgi:hypothetical protein